MLDGVLISKTDSGTGIFMCQKCREVLQEAFGAQNKDELVYVLMCPSCMHIAGQWLTAAERDMELREHAKRVHSAGA
jgi:hypothetical protein